MLLLKKYVIIFLIIIILVLFKLGVYQSDIIKVDNLTIKKPFGYRFYSIPSNETNSKFELFKYWLGFQELFYLENEKILFFSYEYIFFNKEIGLVLTKENNTKLFIDIFKERKNNVIDEKNCIYEIIEEKNIIRGLIKNVSINFNINGESKNDILKIKNDICELK